MRGQEILKWSILHKKLVFYIINTPWELNGITVARVSLL